MVRIHFDLLLSVAASFLYQLLAKDLPRFENHLAPDIFRRFVDMPGTVRGRKQFIIDWFFPGLESGLNPGNRSVRPGKVAYSSGCESRSSKAGQPLDRGPWAGGSNSKAQAQGDQDNRP